MRFTTLFDLYGLPGDFPQMAQHSHLSDTSLRAELLEAAMAEAVQDRRLIPYLQRHEFESLVLAGLDKLEELLDTAGDLQGVAELRASVGNARPEDVDDGPESAPSKRIMRHVPSYQKVLHGPLVVDAVGLPVLRRACPRFDRWVSRLEDLAGEGRP